ncbi:hypothetical protein B0H16DRAFT_1471835 [Mycena metata]|uniref:Uncharacterized protein n=1 Tax=Mycena metata TaxID=1033252 RepID=A0AAD7MPN5_9AGAR|nr:hypothetical protein B0H16DRAFT_1471835 [Mycena metata]
MCFALWEMDVIGEPGGLVVVFWNKPAVGWDHKEALRALTLQHAEQSDDPMEVVREILRLLHLCFFISRHGANISLSQWYTRALRHFVQPAFTDYPESARKRWIRDRLEDKCSLFDDKPLFPIVFQCPLASLRVHSKYWPDPRIGDVSKQLFNGQPVFDYRLGEWHQLFFWLAAVAETGVFHLFDPDAFDPDSEDWPFELSASIAEGAALGLFLQELAPTLPPGSYSPEERFLFHGFTPPPPVPAISADIEMPAASPSPEPVVAAVDPRLLGASPSPLPRASVEKSRPAPSRLLALPPADVHPPSPGQIATPPNPGQTAAPLRAVHNGPGLGRGVATQDPVQLQRVDKGARPMYDAWSDEARKVLSSYAFAYWEHVGNGFFVIPSTFCVPVTELIYNYLPPTNTERATKCRNTERSKSSPVAPTSSAAESGGAPRRTQEETPVRRHGQGKQWVKNPVPTEEVDELLSDSAQGLPVGVRAGDYVADEDDFDVSQLQDLPRTQPPSHAGPSSHPGPDPIFLGFPTSQLLEPNAFDVSNLTADAEMMVAFFEDHRKANETDYFVYMSALLGIVHKVIKHRRGLGKDKGKAPGSLKREKGE